MHRYSEVDVFGSAPLLGNPVAVVHDADDLSDAEMASFARWTNLSETTFLLTPSDPSADYRVRIFTPSTELPFAGHPTLGSCRAWLEAGGVPRREDRIVQECLQGLIELRQDASTRLSFVAPPLVRSGPVAAELLERTLAELGLDASDVAATAWVDNGPGWLGVQLNSADEVLDLVVPATSVPVGVVGLCPPGATAAYEVRAFFPEATGTFEDPVTGSLNASVAQWLLGAGVVTAPYTASQGRALGRAGLISIDVDGDDVLVGGATEVIVTGSVALTGS